VAVSGLSHLEDDFESPDKTRHAEFMDAHGLLLEMQKEKKMLADKEYTHIGIGLAMDAGTVRIAEILSKKTFAIDRLNQSENGGVEVVGRIFGAGGLYAARICLQNNPKKQFGEAAPEHMHVEEIKGTKMKMFSINFKPIQEEVFNAAEPRILELYIRAAGDASKIKYGAAAQQGERLNFKDLKLEMRQPMEFKPDPRVEIENVHDRENFEQEARERA
jgi:hypothetical protein